MGRMIQQHLDNQTDQRKIRLSRLALRILAGMLTAGVLAGAGILLIDNRVAAIGSSLCVTLDNAAGADCVIVPGALVYPDKPSLMLQDRLDTALDVYRSGVVNRILVSGDHGSKDYDEVNIMRQYLLDRGVPAEHIFMDHAGFDTYDTLYRARDVFMVRSAIIVTQTFHLHRALYIGQCLGLDVQGISSDQRTYVRASYYRLRELGARSKAFLECQLQTRPAYLGETIPIQGSGLATVD